MPHYKAIVAFKETNAESSETIHIVIEANNAIHAKALLQDQYGEKSVQSVKRADGDRAVRPVARGSEGTRASA